MSFPYLRRSRPPAAPAAPVEHVHTHSMAGELAEVLGRIVGVLDQVVEATVSREVTGSIWPGFVDMFRDNQAWSFDLSPLVEFPLASRYPELMMFRRGRTFTVRISMSDGSIAEQFVFAEVARPERRGRRTAGGR